MVKRYNISVPKKYEQNGEVKTSWRSVGELVEFEATETKPKGFILELNMFPETKFGVFEKQLQETKQAPLPQSSVNEVKTERVEEVKVEDIPF